MRQVPGLTIAEVNVAAKTGSNGYPVHYLTIRDGRTGRFLLENGYLAVRLRVEGRMAEWRSDAESGPPEAEALSQDLSGSPPAVVADPLARPLPSLLVRRLRRRAGQDAPWREALLVAVFNWEDRAQNKSIRLGELGFSEGATVAVKDWWTGAALGSATGTFLVESIPPHGVKLLEIAVRA